MSKMNKCNEEYDSHWRNWKLVRDIIAGERCIKDHDLRNFNSCYNYLPYPTVTHGTDEDKRYRDYIERASLFNATVRTKNAMVGMIYSKDVTIDLPPELQYLDEDVDGTNVGIVDQSVELISDLIEVGRAGLFVDYPVVEGDLTRADLENAGYRSYIVKYKAEDIIDWYCTSNGASTVLAMVKLREYRCSRDSEYNEISEEVVRMLLLNELGIYEQRIYDSEDNYEVYVPLDNTGEPFDFIPFFFCGSQDNRPDVDISPILELATLNIHHYRNSADYEESLFKIGQPMYTLAGLNDQWIKAYFPDGLKSGSSEVIMLPQGGKIDIAQPNPNTMALEGMKLKEQQMIALGARLISSGGQAETAEAARIKHASDGAVLKVLVKNANTCYNKAIMATQLFNGSVNDFTFEINDDFFDVVDNSTQPMDSQDNESNDTSR